MKIEKIETFGEDKIILTVEGYPHAQPVFDANISEEKLETQLRAWKLNQDEVDTLNSNAPVTVTKPTVKKALTDMIGQTIKDAGN